MEYPLEQHRAHIDPLVYNCLEQLLQQIQKNNDTFVYEKWTQLVETLQHSSESVTIAFGTFTKSICIMLTYHDYLISIMNMFIKYERNQISQNA
jgi:hypothetical protein